MVVIKGIKKGEMLKLEHFSESDQEILKKAILNLGYKV